MNYGILLSTNLALFSVREATQRTIPRFGVSFKTKLNGFSGHGEKRRNECKPDTLKCRQESFSRYLKRNNEGVLQYVKREK